MENVIKVLIICIIIAVLVNVYRPGNTTSSKFGETVTDLQRAIDTTITNIATQTQILQSANSLLTKAKALNNASLIDTINKTITDTQSTIDALNNQLTFLKSKKK